MKIGTLFTYFRPLALYSNCNPTLGLLSHLIDIVPEGSALLLLDGPIGSLIATMRYKQFLKVLTSNGTVGYIQIFNEDETLNCR